jgi:hypothetical protein
MVYEPEVLRPSVIAAIFDSIHQYKKNFKWAKDNGILISAVEEEVLHWVEKIDDIIEKDESGKLEERKETFKRTNTDYKKFHRLPEAYKPEDFAKGQLALEKHMKDSPEDYQ